MDNSSVVTTYMGLRIAMVLLVLLLFVSVGIQIYVTGIDSCFLTSFSAYYYTPVRPVFVAALSAVGVCLILYQGNTDFENVLLDFSGFLAIVVAFVPTGFPAVALLPDGSVNQGCGITNQPMDTDIVLGTTNNVLSLLIVGTIAVIIGAILPLRHWRKSSGAAKIGAIVTTLGLIAALIVFWLRPHFFYQEAHMPAAISLFAGIFFVVAHNAWSLFWIWREAEPSTPSSKKREFVFFVLYTAMFALMPLGAGIAFQLGGEYRVFWIEFTLILLFAVYWAIQTAELRGKVFRPNQATGPILGKVPQG